MIQELVTRRYRRNLPSERGRECRYECRKDETDQSLRRQFSSIRFQVWIWRGDGGKIETKMSRPLACFALARPQNDRSLVLASGKTCSEHRQKVIFYYSSRASLSFLVKDMTQYRNHATSSSPSVPSHSRQVVRGSTGTLHVPSSSNLRS